jgi:hypothetical protein
VRGEQRNISEQHEPTCPIVVA